MGEGLRRGREGGQSQKQKDLLPACPRLCAPGRQTWGPSHRHTLPASQRPQLCSHLHCFLTLPRGCLTGLRTYKRQTRSFYSNPNHPPNQNRTQLTPRMYLTGFAVTVNGNPITLTLGPQTLSLHQLLLGPAYLTCCQFIADLSGPTCRIQPG